MSATRATTRPRTGSRVFVALSISGMIVMNFLANALPFFGRTTAEVSERFPTLITPAGYVFAIWGVIYLGLLAVVAAQSFTHLADDTLPDRLAGPLIVSSIANVVWLLLWHSLNVGWSVAAMLVLLVSLVVAYVRAHTGRPARPSAVETWMIRIPLSIYLGWISVATIANIAGALEATGWDRWGIGIEWWGVILLAVGSGLALGGLVLRSDEVFASVFVWAYAGIALASESFLVRMTAAVLALFIAVWVAASWVLPAALRQET